MIDEEMTRSEDQRYSPVKAPPKNCWLGWASKKNGMQLQELASNGFRLLRGTVRNNGNEDVVPLESIAMTRMTVAHRCDRSACSRSNWS